MLLLSNRFFVAAFAVRVFAAAAAGCTGGSESCVLLPMQIKPYAVEFERTLTTSTAQAFDEAFLELQ